MTVTRTREFLVCPGYIKGQSGKMHWYSATSLIHQFWVHPSECVISCCPGYHESEEGLLHLEPQPDGNYTLPTVEYDPCLLYQPNDEIVRLWLMNQIQTYSRFFA